MLRELHLRDLGVIREASIELAPGLNVVTGETGVGKTLLVTSLSLLMGARGQARMVREGAAEAVVQAVVDAPGGHERHGEDLILVRRLSSDGRSRAWIDGQLAPLSTLAELGETLVEVHGQGAGFALARPARQLAAIDALTNNETILASYRDALRVFRELEREREQLRAGEATRARELELVTYQVDEIERADLALEEEDTLHIALVRLEHGERLGAIGTEALTLAGADGAAGQLAEAHRALQSAAAIDTEVQELVSRLGDVTAESAELAREIRAWTESLDSDVSQLERLRERKALIATLKRKYGGSIEAILDVAAAARARIVELTDADGRIDMIDAELERARADVETLSGDLTKRRKKAAKQLAKLVEDELPALALPKARFDVDVSSNGLTESGADAVAFLFSSSSSTSLDEIGKIASGGELARAMIAVTLALAQAHEIPVLVFDEADQGIGGEAALELGRRLGRLGRSHQVLVVSHLPQIAAYADHHIVVRREEDDVSVESLDESGRLSEISRMLAGLESSKLAKGHARELLDLANSERKGFAPTARAG